MGQKAFIAVDDDMTEVEIDPVKLRDADLIVVRLGNDTYPVTDRDIIKSAQSVIEPLLRKHGLTQPVLFWNHAVSFSRIKIKELPYEKGGESE